MVTIEQSYHGPISSDRYWEGRWRDEKAHNDALMKALQKIADLIDSEANDPLDDAIQIATKALAGDVGGPRHD